MYVCGCVCMHAKTTIWVFQTSNLCSSCIVSLNSWTSDIPPHWRPRWTRSLWCLFLSQFSCNYFLLIVSWHSHNISPASFPKRRVWSRADKTFYVYEKLKGYRKEQKRKIFTKNLLDSSVPSTPSTLAPCPRLLAVPEPSSSTHRSPLGTQLERFLSLYCTMLSLTMQHDSALLWWVEAVWAQFNAFSSSVVPHPHFSLRGLRFLHPLISDIVEWFPGSVKQLNFVIEAYLTTGKFQA